MPPRAYVLIFVFWALLTVITPTLISWSASAKKRNLVAPDRASDLTFASGYMLGGTLLGMKMNRRMMGSIESGLLKNNGTTGKRMAQETAALQAPSPAPAPMAGHEALR